MWFLGGCGPAERVWEEHATTTPRAAGAGDRLWWSDGDGVQVADPTDGATWGRWEGPVAAMVADRSGVWLASGDALVRLDGAGDEVARWSDGSAPALFGAADGAWVGWADGALWGCRPDACRRSPWMGPVDALVDAGDGVVTVDADSVRRVDPTRPDVVWTVEGGGTTATLARDTVVVAGPFDLTGLGVADGAPRWTFPVAAVAPPVAVGGWAVVADEAGVTAIGAASGRPRWRRDAVGVRALSAGPAWTVAAWDGVMADVIDVPSGAHAARFRSDVPPVALPCGWAVVEAGVAGCYRW